MENLVEKTSSSLVDNLRPFLESYIKNHMKTIVKNQETEKENYEYIAHIRPTTPLRKIQDIKSAIKTFVNSNYNSLRSVHECQKAHINLLKYKREF